MAASLDARVVVIGAGMAGLAAAWSLREAGCEVRVLEASAIAGGRLAGERIDGFGIERSLQILRSNDTELQRFIREVGVADDLLPMRPVVAAQLHRGRVESYAAQSVLEIARIRGVRRLHGLRVLRLPRLMRRYAHLLDRHEPERAADWDFRSVADFARLYFGESVYQRWIGPLSTSASLGDAQELSRVVFMLEWIADEKGRLGVARRGLAELPAAASEKLEVSLRSAVDSLESASGDGYKVSCRGGATLEVDAVVLATSGREAGRIARGQLVPAEQDFFASLRTVPENVLVAALARPATGVPQYVRVPAVENEVVEALLVEPGVADGRAPLGSGLVTAVANQRFCEANTGASDEVVQKELVASIERAFPSIVGTVRSTHLFREGREVPRFEVGAYRALARFRNVQSDRRKLGRRLYFAGDYLSGLAADQTVGSGRRAARDLIDDLRI